MKKLIYLTIPSILCALFFAGCSPTETEIATMTASAWTPTPPPTPSPTPTETEIPINMEIVEELLKPGKIVEHPPTENNPYYFYTYFPRSAKSQTNLIVTVYPHGGGKSDYVYEYHKGKARFEILRFKNYSEQYKFPLVVAAVPREGNHYITTLVPYAFTTTNDMHYRPDLKIIDAVWNQYIPQLQKAGYIVDEKVFLFGFSSVSSFSMRFTIIHPELVKAVWLGGNATAPIPASEYNGTEINYPVGVNNLEKLTGKPFNFEVYKTVPHMIAIGKEDTKPEQDTTNFRECYSAADANFIRSNFGKTKVERARFFYEYLVSIGVPAEYSLHVGIGHKFTEGMEVEAFEFFISHKD